MKPSFKKNSQNAEKEYPSLLMAEDEWRELSPEEQLLIDNERALMDIARAEQSYAESSIEREKWIRPSTPKSNNKEEPEHELPPPTPGRSQSPDVALEIPDFPEIDQAQRVEDDSEVTEESSDEVNYHMDGGSPCHTLQSLRRDKEAVEKHRLPTDLVNVITTNYAGTHNDEEYCSKEELQEVLEENADKVQFFAMFEEYAPTTGHKHYHSILILKTPQRAHICIKLDPRAFWQRIHGRVVNYWKYMSKDGREYYTFGNMPDSIARAVNNEGKRQAPTKAEVLWAETVQKAKQGDESIRDLQVYARHRMYFDDILASVHQDKIFNGELKVKNKWIYGPPGTGKTRQVWQDAREQNKTIFVKNCNKWWDGYSGHNIVLMDDVGETIKVLANHVKNWSDRYPFTAEVKGGTRRINTCDFEFIVTSNYSIDQLFNETDAEAIHRRFEEVYVEAQNEAQK